MHLIIKYHRTEPSTDEGELPSESEWQPTWHLINPGDPHPEPSRGPTIILTGEKRLPILAPGTMLEPGEIYLDLKLPGHGPFRALEGQRAGEGNAYIAQGELTPEFWHQLVRLCARAGELVVDAERAGSACDVTIVMEPLVAVDAGTQ